MKRSATSTRSIQSIASSRLTGVLLALLLALLAWRVCLLPLPFLQVVGPLMPAMLLGLLLSSCLKPSLRSRLQPGLSFARNRLLRVGIVLYGFRISLADLQQVGMTALLTDLLVVMSTLAVAAWIGIRWLRLDSRTALLVGAGSAVCGAAAILATAPVVRARNSDISVAIATVVLFGSAAMMLYPILYTLPEIQQLFNYSELAVGRLVGATVHEVAQVAAAAQSLEAGAAHAAVITKMIRVMLLAPVLFGLSYWLNRKSNQQNDGARVNVPWFALVFLLMPWLNSGAWIPEAWLNRVLQADTLLLAVAMAALGLDTHIGAVIKAGRRPLLLGAILFIFLLLCGVGLTVVLGNRFG
ncbi:YeiH family protein [Methylomarinum vadi]|uniref:YeiH family protein n=1 Tax=Methylomarinum vadi TaxID=438855 RepID=UPI0004DEDC82|nr:putative sulfate exporter family transporter [Methylomarinum vadi]